MPIARFQMPDGRIARFEVPQGTSPEQAQMMMEQELANMAQPQKPPTASTTLQDVGVAGASGVVGAAKSMTDFFGADNAASKALSEASTSLQGMYTPERQKEMQYYQQLQDEAAKRGDTMGEIGAAFQGIKAAPLQGAVQAVGSLIPNLATLFIPGAGQARALQISRGAVNTALGIVQGTGAVKGALYEGVKQELMKNGMDEASASKQAEQAQSYLGPNTDQILLGAAIGYGTGKLGAEELLSPTVQGAARKAAAVASEAGTEALQGGQEQVAQNLGLTRAGMETPMFQGVAGAATQEGILGGLGAGPVTLLHNRQPQQKPAEPLLLEYNFKPTPLPDGRVAMTRSELDQYEDEQFRKKYETQPYERGNALTPDGSEALRLEYDFKPTPLPDGTVAMTKSELDAYLRKKREDQVNAPKRPELLDIIDKINARIGKQAKPVTTSGRTAMPTDKELNYATATQEIELLKKQKKTKQRDARIAELEEVKRVENLVAFNRIARIDPKDAAKALNAGDISRFDYERIVKSNQLREYFLSNDVDSDQAKDTMNLFMQKTDRDNAYKDLPAKTIEAITPALNEIQELEAQRAALESSKAKKGPDSLWNILSSPDYKLSASEIKALAGKQNQYFALRATGNTGKNLRDLVSEDTLDDFLPPELRSNMGDDLNRINEAVKYIQNKITTKNYASHDTDEAIDNLDRDISSLGEEIDYHVSQSGEPDFTDLGDFEPETSYEEGEYYPDMGEGVAPTPKPRMEVPFPERPSFPQGVPNEPTAAMPDVGMPAGIPAVPPTGQQTPNVPFPAPPAPTPQVQAPVAPKTSTALTTIPYDTVSFAGEGQPLQRTSGSSQVINFGGRMMVVRNVNGVMVPFYLSTGRGGKADVASGKWYPFFGIGADGWINKTGGSEMTNYYGSESLRQAANELDNTIGDIRNDSIIPKVSSSGRHIDFINQGMSPTENQQSDTVKKVRENIDNVVNAIEGQKPSTAVSAAETDIIEGEAREVKEPTPAPAIEGRKPSTALTTETTDIIEGQMRVIDEDTIKPEVLKLSAPEQQVLADHYGEEVNSPAFLAKVREDIYNFANKGAQAVASAIRKIIRKLHAALLATTIIMNPSFMGPQYQVALPQNVTTVEQVLAKVPDSVKNKMSPGAQQAYANIMPAFGADLQKNNKLFIITDKPNARIFVFDSKGQPILDKKVLLGLQTGDYYKGDPEKNKANRITPAGLYTMGLRDAKRGVTESGGDEAATAGGYDFNKVFVLDKAAPDGSYSVTLFHSVYTKMSDAKRRLAALDKEGAEDSRYSFGCINVDKDTYKSLLDKYEGQMDGAKLFVVPDNPDTTMDFLRGKAINAGDLSRQATPEVTKTVTKTVPGAPSAAKETTQMAARKEEEQDTRRGLYMEAKRGEKGMSKADVDVAVNRIKSTWENAPDIEVVQKISELPEEIQADIARDKVNPRGVYDPDTKKVWLVADNIPNDAQAAITLAHESFGHFGLRVALGKNFKPMMNSIYEGNKDVRSRADAYINDGMNKVTAVEEVLSEMAQEVYDTRVPENKNKLNALQKVMNAIRQFLARIGVPMKSISDAQVLALIANARRSVVRGGEFVNMEGGKSLYSVKNNVREFKNFFNRAEKIPESKGVQAIRENWIGGVSGIGDRNGVYDLHRVIGGDRYIKRVQDLTRKELGDNFKGYRLMSKDEFDELKNGSMGSQFVSFTLNPNFAEAFKNVPSNAKRKDLVLVEMDLTPDHVYMIGHPGEQEVVIDYGQGYNPDAIKEFKKEKGQSLYSIKNRAQQAAAKAAEAIHKAGQKRRMDEGLLDDLPEHLQAKARKTFTPENETIVTKVNGLQDKFWQKMAQGIVDQYRTIKDYTKEGYMLARMSKTIDGALEGMLFHGQVFLNGGALDIKSGTKGLLQIMAPLGKDVDRYQMWVALNREADITKKSQAAQQDIDQAEADIARMRTMKGNAGKAFDKETKNILDNKDLSAAKKRDALSSLRRQLDKYKNDIDKAINAKRKEIAGHKNRIKAPSIDAELVEARDKFAEGMIDGRPKIDVYREVQREMNKLNRSVLNVALEQGLINKEAYDIFASDINYIPFYKMMEDGDLQGAATASGLGSQYFSRALEGGEKPFGDLMENTLRNWSHILSASMKNKAAAVTLEAASEVEGARPNLKVGLEWKNGKVYSSKTGAMVDDGSLKPEYTTSEGTGIIKVMVDGQPTYYKVLDDLLLDSVASIGYLGPKSKFLDVARDFKNILQFGVTLSPGFKVRNLFRDSIQAMAVSGLKLTPWANIVEGWAASDRNNPAHISALAGGAIFNFGSAYEGDQSRMVKKLIKMGVDRDSILDTDGKIKAGLMKAWSAYTDLGNKSESANRMALYQQMRDKGMSHLEASFHARDLMDFSMQGSFPALRMVTQIVPFLNARLQGLYKLGRDGIIPTSRVIYNSTTGKPIDADDKMKAQQFSIVTGAVMMASMMLYLAFKDDEEFKKREEWDRDNFWWFRLPGMETAVRVPKPFEIGAFGTMAERLLEQMVDQGAEGKQFEDSIKRMLSDTFAMNPTPQMIKPMIDLYANKDSFTGAPIETAGMERLSKAERASDTTSPLAIALSAAQRFVSPSSMEMSPVQVDYAIKSYFGWLGGTVAATSHYAVMPFAKGAYPDHNWTETMSMGFIKSLPATQSKFVTAFYENNKQISQAYADMRHYAEIGDQEMVMKILEEKGDLIGLQKAYDRGAKDMAKIRQAITAIRNDPTMGGDQKKEEIDRLKVLIGTIAEQLESVRKSVKK